MWAGKPIFGKWSELHLIGRRLVARRYLLPSCHGGSTYPDIFYRLINKHRPDTPPVLTLRNSTASIVTLYTIPCLQSMRHRMRSHRTLLQTHRSPMTLIEPFHLCFEFLSLVLLRGLSPFYVHTGNRSWFRQMFDLFLLCSNSVITTSDHDPPQRKRSALNTTASFPYASSEALTVLFVIEEVKVRSSARRARAYVAEPSLISACKMTALVFLPCLNTPNHQLKEYHYLRHTSM